MDLFWNPWTSSSFFLLPRRHPWHFLCAFAESVGKLIWHPTFWGTWRNTQIKFKFGQKKKIFCWLFFMTTSAMFRIWMDHRAFVIWPLRSRMWYFASLHIVIQTKTILKLEQNPPPPKKLTLIKPWSDVILLHQNCALNVSFPFPTGVGRGKRKEAQKKD